MTRAIEVLRAGGIGKALFTAAAIIVLAIDVVIAGALL